MAANITFLEQHAPIDEYGRALYAVARSVLRALRHPAARPAAAPVGERPVTAVAGQAPALHELVDRLSELTEPLSELTEPDWRATMRWQDQLQEGGEVVGAIKNPR